MSELMCRFVINACLRLVESVGLAFLLSSRQWEELEMRSEQCGKQEDLPNWMTPATRGGVVAGLLLGGAEGPGGMSVMDCQMPAICMSASPR